jgi:hypothetical protein
MAVVVEATAAMAVVAEVTAAMAVVVEVTAAAIKVVVDIDVAIAIHSNWFGFLKVLWVFTHKAFFVYGDVLYS